MSLGCQQQHHAHQLPSQPPALGTEQRCQLALVPPTCQHTPVEVSALLRHVCLGLNQLLQLVQQRPAVHLSTLGLQDTVAAAWSKQHSQHSRQQSGNLLCSGCVLSADSWTCVPCMSETPPPAAAGQSLAGSQLRVPRTRFSSFSLLLPCFFRASSCLASFSAARCLALSAVSAISITSLRARCRRTERVGSGRWREATAAGWFAHRTDFQGIS